VPHRILSISYDDTLLQTRQLMLEMRGYDVTSTYGFTSSLEQCRHPHWDLLVMGHSIPNRDKAALMEEFRRHSQAPVLALHRFGDGQLAGADRTVTPDHPELLLEAVDQILATRETAGR
jgi:DNA-binding response OmpR family regulator